ncbi:hypothetical protein [Paenibacillus marchantiophytorum]|nr:hypothetical protein [Paenibacillus marchantiophytorum]
MDRERFNYALNRDTFLTALGWKMLHFSLDDIQNRSEVCRMLLQMALGPSIARNTPLTATTIMEKEVLRLAWQLGRWIRPKDVTTNLGVDFRTARKWLHTLVERGCLSPIVRGADVRHYELKAGSFEHL